MFDPPLLGPAIGDATNGGQLGNAPGRVQSVGLGATHTFSPTLLLDWNFGYNRQRLGSTFDLVSANGLTDLGIPGTNNAGAPGDPTLYYGYPGFIFPPGQHRRAVDTEQSGATSGNAQPANPFLFRDNQYVTGANLSWIKGRHAFRGGIEWNHAQINHFQPQGGTFQQPRGAFAVQWLRHCSAGDNPDLVQLLGRFHVRSADRDRESQSALQPKCPAMDSVGVVPAATNGRRPPT